MTSSQREAGSPASRHPELLKHRQRGASPLTARIYTVVAEAGDEGLTVKEIHEQLKDVPGFLSDTLRWAKETGNDQIPLKNGSERDLILGRRRIQQRIQRSLVKHGMLVSLGDNGRYESRYVAGRPPLGYRRKMIPNTGPTGYVPIDLTAESTNSRSHIRIMQLLDEAEKELANPKSRKLRALLTEAVDFLRAENK